MPMDPITLLPIMTSSLASSGIVGPNLPQLASGLANGLSAYAVSSLVIKSINVGTAGAGVGAGLGLIIPPSIFATMASSFVSNGLVGVYSPSLSIAVSSAFIQSFSLGIVTVASVGVGVGSGVSSAVPNPIASYASFFSGFISSGMSGVSVPQLASAVSTGLDLSLAASFGVVVIAGPPSPVASSGAGIGKIF